MKVNIKAIKSFLLLILLFTISSTSLAFRADDLTKESLLLKWEMCSGSVKQAAKKALNTAIAERAKQHPNEKVSGVLSDISNIRIMSEDPISFVATIPYTIKYESNDGFGGGVNKELIIHSEPFGKPGIPDEPIMQPPGTPIYGCSLAVQK